MEGAGPPHPAPPAPREDPSLGDRDAASESNLAVLGAARAL